MLFNVAPVAFMSPFVLLVRAGTEQCLRFGKHVFVFAVLFGVWVVFSVRCSVFGLDGWMDGWL